KGMVEKMRIQNEQINGALQTLGRKLSRAEEAFITHGGTKDELIEILNNKLEADVMKAMAIAEQQGGGNVENLRGEYDILRSMAIFTNRMSRNVTEEQLKRILIPATAMFKKARELQVIPRYALIIQKT